jgi:hypothetical protein
LVYIWRQRNRSRRRRQIIRGLLKILLDQRLVGLDWRSILDNWRRRSKCSWGHYCLSYSI